ncbi:ROK family transcriptional regulator [Gordoniibacillus kamchatkensis]|uniref:ROK family transcriptional regulator n=1 Tax=Gordoniibacillus kamchatkensis TaxID=1590651 RepID=A0ABR5AMD3_9BACL|nr:ROK family protein [Paenibacillus sp. VKM B-2647]KIL42169.1 ROK family transcriptional regulator [Paenibacillus sp. VKM B-2647]
MDTLIGIDLGGTNIVCGLSDLEGNLLHMVKLPTEAERGSDDVLRKMADMTGLLVRQAGRDMKSVRAIGVGTPGFIDPVRGVNKFSSNLKWENVPMAGLLSAMTNKPVFINNDVKMYMYGEALKGAGQGHPCVLGVTIGTGLSAAVIHNGDIFYGGDYLAGELGHVPIEGNDFPCKCGMTGCLETIVSATGIAGQARRGIESGRDSVMSGWHPDLSQLTAADVSLAYDMNDSLAIDVMNRTGKVLAIGLSFAIPLVSPDVVLIGGGGALAGPRLFRPLQEELARRVHPMYMGKLAVKPAMHNEHAGVIGSALYALKQLSD